MSKLFIYGTLHDNHSNKYSRFLENNAHFIGVAWTKGKLFNIGRYPGAIQSNDTSDIIKGYLYDSDNIEPIFNKLDEYEGYNKMNPHHSLFIRKRVLVIDEENKRHWAWIYLYNKNIGTKKKIDGGDFWAYRLKNDKKRELVQKLS